jgi:hypothetical protein
MAYNSITQAYLRNLTKDTVPQRWLELARRYKSGEFTELDGDLAIIIPYLAEHVLSENKIETSSKEVKSELEPKPEQEDVSVEINTTDEYNDLPETNEEEE